MTEGYCVKDLTAKQIENIKEKLGMIDSEQKTLSEAADILEFRGLLYLAKRIREQTGVESD